MSNKKEFKNLIRNYTYDCVRVCKFLRIHLKYIYKGFYVCIRDWDTSINGTVIKLHLKARRRINGDSIEPSLPFSVTRLRMHAVSMKGERIEEEQSNYLQSMFLRIRRLRAPGIGIYRTPVTRGCLINRQYMSNQFSTWRHTPLLW